MAEAADDRPRDASHPLIAAQSRTLGPLSPAGKEVWHGNATPCVACCQLLPRSGGVCEHCGQDHRPEMLEKMARHSGPWFIYDHVRPLPGLSLERIARLADRETLTRTSIVRGPTTCYQWRFAGETPLIARLLGLCWNCQSDVDRNGATCAECGVPLDGRGAAGDDVPTAEVGALENEIDDELRALGEIAATGEFRHADTRASQPPLGKVTLLFFVITAIIALTIVIIARMSRRETAAAGARAVVAAVQAPVFADAGQAGPRHPPTA